MDVPIAQDRKNVPPRLGGEHPQENPEGRGSGTPEISRLTTHIRNVSLAKRHRRENGIQYARSFRRRIHAENIHPRHAANAGERCRKVGQFHGAGHVKIKRASEGMVQTSSPTLSRHFAVWVSVWVKHGNPTQKLRRSNQR